MRANGGDIAACPIDTDRSVEASAIRCGTWSELAPKPTLMSLINLSLSLPPLLFGLVFSWAAVKTLLRRASNRVASSATKSFSSKSASAASSAAS